MQNQFYKKIREYLFKFDLPLLCFLCLIIQDRIVLKLAAIFFIFAIQIKVRSSGTFRLISPFYYLIILFELLKYLLIGSEYLGNWSTLLVSTLYWCLAWFTSFKLKQNVEFSGAKRVSGTLYVFSVLNFVVCVWQLILVMLTTKTLNPYAVEVFAPDIRYPEILFPYGHSSGDLIRGIFYDNHQNAIVAQFLLIFFLFKRQYIPLIMNTFIICVTCFNLVTLLTVLILGVCFIVVKTSKERSIIAGLVVTIFTFYILITPENIQYLAERIENSYKSVTEQKSGIVTSTRIKNSRFDSSNNEQKEVDSTALLYGEKTLVDTSYNIDEVSGKKISYSQTYLFLKSYPVYAIFGCGAGSFSSKLANNFSGVFAGSTLLNRNLPAPDYTIYFQNHGSINRFLSKQVIGKHSVNNFPNSVYNQLLAEYGLIGLLIFAIFYVGYYCVRYKKLTFGLMLLPLLLIYFNYGYYFETVDIVVFFELLMFLDVAGRNVFFRE